MSIELSIREPSLSNAEKYLLYLKATEQEQADILHSAAVTWFESDKKNKQALSIINACGLLKGTKNAFSDGTANYDLVESIYKKVHIDVHDVKDPAYHKSDDEVYEALIEDDTELDGLNDKYGFTTDDVIIISHLLPNYQDRDFTREMYKAILRSCSEIYYDYWKRLDHVSKEKKKDEEKKVVKSLSSTVAFLHQIGEHELADEVSVIGYKRYTTTDILNDFEQSCASKFIELYSILPTPYNIFHDWYIKKSSVTFAKIMRTTLI